MNASDVEERNVSRVAAGMSGMESMPHMIMDFYLCLFNRRLAAGDYYGHGRWYHLQHRAGRHWHFSALHRNYLPLVSIFRRIHSIIIKIINLEKANYFKGKVVHHNR